MLVEKFVTLEQAQAIKELGFPQEYDDFISTRIHYNKEGVLCYHSNIGIYDNILCACPTLSLVQKWLREERKLHIYMTPITKESLSNKVYGYGFDIYVEENGGLISDYKAYETYEKALGAAIDKCIELW